jgi:uncharacterized protein (DUF302 family)
MEQKVMMLHPFTSYLRIYTEQTHHKSIKEIKKMFRKAGFGVLSVTSVPPFIPNPRRSIH